MKSSRIRNTELLEAGAEILGKPEPPKFDRLRNANYRYLYRSSPEGDPKTKK
jgi:hypothetical protein